MLVLALAIAALAFDPPTESLLWSSGDEGAKFYRIPSITATGDGALLAVADKMWERKADLPNDADLVVKRSTDGGLTWGPTFTIAACERGRNRGYSDASWAVDRKTGDVLCVFNGGNGILESQPDDLIRMFYRRSADNGLTWGPEVDITDQMYGKDCSHPIRRFWKGMFIPPGKICQTHEGRMIQSSVVFVDSETPSGTYAVYSDDFGLNWDVTAIVAERGDEGKITELNNGSLLMSIRHPGVRYFSLSSDGGLTWDPYYKNDDVHDPGVNQEIITYTLTRDGYDKNRLIHTIPYSSIRENLTIMVSYDEGLTWPVKKVIYTGAAGVSSATILADGRVAVLYERENGEGFDIICNVMTLEWITDGYDKWSPPKPIRPDL